MLNLQLNLIGLQFYIYFQYVKSWVFFQNYTYYVDQNSHCNDKLSFLKYFVRQINGYKNFLLIQ